MNHSDANRPSTRPGAHPTRHSSPPDTFHLESDPPSSGFAGEDFLYHLSRGSELLKENQVQAAKEELEVALRLQPMDLRGQGLLGFVYFRLGLYPRAIDIYRQLVDAFGNEITPKVNLALCYVKTGQHLAARELLEEVVRCDPEHHRAWSYLGLVFQFLRAYTKAEAAFERAGQRGMAERMRQMTSQGERAPSEPPIPEVRWELRAAVKDAFSEIETSAAPFHVDAPTPREKSPGQGRWHATEPGEEAIPELDRSVRRSSPPPSVLRSSSRPAAASQESGQETTPNGPALLRGGLPNQTQSKGDSERSRLRDWVARRTLAMGAGPFAEVDTRTIFVDLAEPFAVRATAVVVVSPSELTKREIRIACRTRTNEDGQPLGGAQAPIVGLLGPGSLIARAEQGVVELFDLDDESLTVRHSVLFGLSLALRYEFERIKLGPNEGVDVVQLNGRGTVALNLRTQAMTMEIGPGGLLVRLSELVGWTARVLPEPVDPAEAPGRARGFVVLRGEGAAIVI